VTRLTAAVAGLVLAVVSGCAPMCQTPFDYCNAVLNPNGCPNCDFGARYGSRFHPMNGTPPTTPITPTPATPDADDGSHPPENDEPTYDDTFGATGTPEGGTASSGGATADEIDAFLASRGSELRTRGARPAPAPPRQLMRR